MDALYGGKKQYESGDTYITVRELLLRAFRTGWKLDSRGLTEEEYMTSSVNVIQSMQVEPTSIYCEEGQDVNEGELAHLEDLMRTDGAWVYYGVEEENFFLLQWMPTREEAAAKLAQLEGETDSVSYEVQL